MVRRARKRTERAALWDYSDLAVLSAFALAQPIFDLLRPRTPSSSRRATLPRSTS